MTNVLHPQKHSVPKAKTAASTLETTNDEKPMGAEQRHQMTAKAAYRLAPKRSFVGGNPENNWYEAEAKIDQLFSQSSGAPS